MRSQVIIFEDERSILIKKITSLTNDIKLTNIIFQKFVCEYVNIKKIKFNFENSLYPIIQNLKFTKILLLNLKSKLKKALDDYNKIDLQYIKERQNGVEINSNNLMEAMYREVLEWRKEKWRMSLQGNAAKLQKKESLIQLMEKLVALTTAIIILVGTIISP